MRGRRGRYAGALIAVFLGLAVFPATGATPAATWHRYIVVFKTSVPRAASVALEHSQRFGVDLGFVYEHALKGYAGRLPDSLVAALEADPRVASVVPDAEVTALDTQAGATWGLDRIDQRALPLSGTFGYTRTGAGVTVYVIDTGFRFSHSDFGGRAISGYDAVDGGTADDCNGHGTHVAGTVGGTTYGVAKGVRLVAVRVLDCSAVGLWSGVIAGVDWVTQDHDPGELAVANMSLGGSANSAVDTAVRNSIADGVSYAIAAGNGNNAGVAQDACTISPARVAEAMTIGATDKTDAKVSWSNYGSCVDWFAPGVGITSDWYTGDTATNTISGTSMATPHTSGVAALYLEGHPGATPAEVRAALYGLATKSIVSSASTGNNHLLYAGVDETPGAAGSPVTVGPVGDAQVQSSSPTSSYGGATTFRLRGASPTYNGYLKFDVAGVTGTVQSAKLRLFVTDRSVDGGHLYEVSNNFLGTSTPWTESALTWNNAPAIAGTELQSVGATTLNTWVELDVSSVVTGNGTYSFGLTSPSTDSEYYSSKEGANPPQLVLTLSSGPDTTPPSVAGRSPGPSATGVPVGATVTATFSEDVQNVDGTTFTLTGPSGPVTASVSYAPASLTATLTPGALLAPNAQYTAALTSGITDKASSPNALAPVSWSFTTAGAPPSGAIGLSGAPVGASVTTGSTVPLPAWTPAANELILVSVAQRDESKVISVSGNCPTWREVANVDNVQGQGGVSLWWAQCPVPTAGSITVTIAGNTLPVAVIAQRFTGVDTTTPVEQAATNAGPAVDDRNMLGSVTTQTAGAWVVAAGWHRTAAFSVPTGETGILVNQLAGSGGDVTRASMWYEGPVATPASTQLGAASDLSAANDWAMIAVSLRPSG